MKSLINGLDILEPSWNGQTLDDILSGKIPLTNQQEFLSNFALEFSVGKTFGGVAGSGRQALKKILVQLSKSTKKRELLVPIFNCKSVSAVARIAGFEPRFYDLQSPIGGLPFQTLERVLGSSADNTAAIVITHYFGAAQDFTPIRELCKEREVDIIEDCAHTVGGTIEGKPTGSLGDHCFFSFNYDKPIAIGWGGVAFSNKFELDSSPEASPGVELQKIQRVLRFYAMRKRNLSRVFSPLNKTMSKLDSLHDLLVAKTYRGFGPVDGEQQEETGLSWLGASLAQAQLTKMPEISTLRNSNNDRLREAVPQDNAWLNEPGNKANWLKLKILLPDWAKPSDIMRKANLAGIKIGQHNWKLNLSVSERRMYPNAQICAERSVELPIHQGMDENHLEILRDIVKSTYEAT